VAAVGNLHKAVERLTEYIKAADASERATYDEVLRGQALLSEEVDVLWWIINGYSQELGKARDQASAAELALPSAHELADLVAAGAPPAASLEYLRHALSSTRGETPQHLTVMDAVEGPGRTWTGSVVVDLPEEIPEHLVPLISGLRILGEVLAKDDRGQFLRDRTGLAGSFAATPEEVALQFVRELSLIGCLSAPRL